MTNLWWTRASTRPLACALLAVLTCTKLSSLLTTALLSSKSKGKPSEFIVPRRATLVSYSAQAFRTKYLQLGDLSHRHFFLMVLKVGEV